MTTDDEQAILDAVRTVLGEDGLTRAGTGVFVRNGELEQTLDHTLVPEHTTDFSIKQARIQRLEADRATVDLDATIVTVTQDSGFTSKSTTRAQGPVSLVRQVARGRMPISSSTASACARPSSRPVPPDR